jgi:uncharacterized protein (TIGR04222 family)
LVEPFLWTLVLLPAWALFVWLPATAGGFRPRPGEERILLSTVSLLGFLRGGEKAAIGTAVVALYSKDHVAVNRVGQLTRSGAPKGLDPDFFSAAVYGAMPTPTWLRGLSARPRVRTALAKVEAELASLGMVPGRLRWLSARLLLLAAGVGSVYRLLSPGTQPEFRVIYAVAITLAAAAWFVPRRTIRGHRELGRLQRMSADLLSKRPEEVPPEFAASAYAMGGIVPPGLAKVFARNRIPRPPDDHPSQRDFDSGPGYMP